MPKAWGKRFEDSHVSAMIVRGEYEFYFRRRSVIFVYRGNQCIVFQCWHHLHFQIRQFGTFCDALINIKQEDLSLNTIYGLARRYNVTAIGASLAAVPKMLGPEENKEDETKCLRIPPTTEQA